MRCHQCQCTIEPGEEREMRGKQLCEDCYIDALSPARPCDPWASLTAQSAAELAGEKEQLTENQKDILEVLQAGAVSLDDLAHKTSLEPAEVERDLATLHHMGKVGGQRVGEKIIYQLWDAQPRPHK